jgi:hypothetical protein
MGDDLLRQRLSGFDEGRDSDGLGLSKPLGTVFRLTSQAAGLLLIILGAYYALHIVADGIQAARNPADLEPAVEGMVRTLELEKANVPVQDEKVPLGRPVAFVALLLWYGLCALVALKLVGAGGRLVLGIVSERREFLAAMKEFLVTMRTEGSDSQAKKKN